MSAPFFFHTRFHLVRLLGLRARDPGELLERIEQVPVSSIYYHTHKFLQQHHCLTPEPTNDFAYWINNILNVRELGEALASVNIVEYGDMEAVRAEFAGILKNRLRREKKLPSCQEGMEFHFMSCASFDVPTGHVANDVGEFLEMLEKISVNSLYFHVFEARLRLGRGENDFSAWLRDVGLTGAADRIASLDPYSMTLNGLRRKIIDTVKTHATNR